jgi:rod shape-determining protein MreD
MRYLIFAAITVVNLIFQNAVFPNLNIAGIAPDIIICSTISIVLLDNSMAGAWIGLLCGLVLDLYTGVIGFYAIPYFIAGAAAYFVRKNIYYIDKVILPFSFAVGAYFLKELVGALLAYILDKQFSLAVVFLRYMLPGAAFTGVFMFLIYFFMRRIYRIRSVKTQDSEDLKKLL